MFKGKFHGIETEAPRRPQPLLRQACPVLSQATEMLLTTKVSSSEMRLCGFELCTNYCVDCGLFHL